MICASSRRDLPAGVYRLFTQIQIQTEIEPGQADVSLMGRPLLLHTDSLVTWACPSWAVLSFSAQTAQSRGHVPHGQSSPSPNRQPSHVDMSVMDSLLLLRTDSLVRWTCLSWAALSFPAQAAQSRGHVPHRQSSHSPHRQPSHVDMSLMDSPLILRTDSPVTWICPS